MTEGSRVVFGVYTDRRVIEMSVNELERAGFSGSDISALFSDEAITKEFAARKGTKAPEGGAIGGIAGALISLDIPQHEARHYEERIKKGDILLAVRSGNAESAARAEELLTSSGAEDVRSESEFRAALG